MQENTTIAYNWLLYFLPCKEKYVLTKSLLPAKHFKLSIFLTPFLTPHFSLPGLSMTDIPFPAMMPSVKDGGARTSDTDFTDTLHLEPPPAGRRGGQPSTLLLNGASPGLSEVAVIQYGCSGACWIPGLLLYL